MTFDVTGLLIFLLAIVPGFVAQQSRYSIIPRSLQEKSLVEETGDYVLNSVFIHLIVLSCFRIYLLLSDLPLSRPEVSPSSRKSCWNGFGSITTWFLSITSPVSLWAFFLDFSAACCLGINRSATGLRVSNHSAGY
jgi:hypothetical protein